MEAARVTAFVLISSSLLFAQSLSNEQMAMLQDGGGWEILSITDAHNGFETKHTCFNPNDKGPCRVVMTFRRDGTFAYTLANGANKQDRSGTYTLDGSAITFFDEMGNKDGPATVTLDLATKMLTLERIEAGVTSRTQLQLESEYRRRAAHQKKNAQP